MEHAERMYLVPQRQLDKLKAGTARESIHQVVENDLDMTMRDILHRNDLEPHAKAKMYTSVLQRFLTLSKLADSETNTLTLSLPSPVHADKEEEPAVSTGTNTQHVLDVVADDVLKNIPQRNEKNVRYILDKMSKTKDIASWTESGEFVFKGRTIPGSHMLDLVKSVMAPQKILDERRPTGWNEFLEAFASLNMPYSMVPNHYVRHTINSFKTKSTPPITKSSKKSKKHEVDQSTPSGQFNYLKDGVFKSPALDRSKWLHF